MTEPDIKMSRAIASAFISSSSISTYTNVSLKYFKCFVWVMKLMRHGAEEATAVAAKHFGCWREVGQSESGHTIWE